MMQIFKALRPFVQVPRCSFSIIPEYKPTKPIKHELIKLPPRPEMEADDPTQVYDIARLRDDYNKFRSGFKDQHTIGSQYVAVAKEGRVYHLFDASRMPFGKMCQRIAQLIQGKHKPTFKYNTQGIGDQCVVINAENIRFTGKKIYNKHLRYHTGYIGNLKEIQYKKLIKEKPEQLISWGVWKQLPKNTLRMKHLEYLDIFRTREHNYIGILPQILPRPVKFIYNGSIAEDVQNLKNEGLIYSLKVDKQDSKTITGQIEQESYDHEVFTPFAMRDTDVKNLVGQKEQDKQIRRYKKLLNRYRRHYAKAPRIRDKRYNPERTYLVENQKRLKELGLKHLEPLDDDPEIEEEIVK